ncbi:hypothetical protein JTB14_032475 [Gonioctena quinquepunctata]|nr:hypothetical protein JTB14_032475 [Gonioctena quinquepunctata]
MLNRVKGFEFKKDKAMNRRESEVAVRTDDKLCITKWKDNKSVLMISTAFGREPETEVEKWNKKEKKRTGISCPAVIKSYNENVGGVDVCDQMMEYYRSFFRTRKWTVKTILHLFDLAIVNSWMEYRTSKANKLWIFWSSGLVLENTWLQVQKNVLEKTDEEDNSEYDINQENKIEKRRVAASLPCVDKRLEAFEHWPNNDDMKNPVKCRSLTAFQMPDTLKIRYVKTTKPCCNTKLLHIVRERYGLKYHREFNLGGSGLHTTFGWY